ncbi:MAG: type II toxin-antitoxin system PemK/MazF family toxin [Aequorivita sp.]|nr:type II toxin-antitoxin system PemK/MazF family toxin [Aequorivita sp.]
MKQGEIWNVYFDPIKGSEQAGNRPAVIISGQAMNNNLGVIIVCPITSSVKNFKGNPILEPTEDNGLLHVSEIMVFHIRAVSKLRFKKRIGFVSEKQLELIKNTLNAILRH